MGTATASICGRTMAVTSGNFMVMRCMARTGRQLGEIKGKDRLITNISKKGCRRGVFAQYAPRAAYARYANYVGYVMYAGSRTFPRPRCCNSRESKLIPSSSRKKT